MTKYSEKKKQNNETNHDKTKRKIQTNSKNKAKNNLTKQIKAGKSFLLRLTLKDLDIWWKLVVIDREMFKEKLNSSRAGKNQDI